MDTLEQEARDVLSAVEAQLSSSTDAPIESVDRLAVLLSALFARSGTICADLLRGDRFDQEVVGELLDVARLFMLVPEVEEWALARRLSALQVKAIADELPLPAASRFGADAEWLLPIFASAGPTEVVAGVRAWLAERFPARSSSPRMA